MRGHLVTLVMLVSACAPARETNALPTGYPIPVLIPPPLPGGPEMRYGEALGRWGTPAEERVLGDRRRVVFKSDYCHKILVFSLPGDVLVDGEDRRPDGSKLGRSLNERLRCLDSLRARE